jgi:YbbR domain-containing protein
VHGPENVLDTLKSVRTKVYEFSDISHNLLREVKLDLPDGVTSKVKKVLLNVPVEQFTEAAFEIPVNILNVPDSLRIKLFPAKIRVSCRVGLSEYADLSRNSFKAYVNFNNNLLTMTKLPVQLAPFPPSVLSAEYFPKEVEYVIEYK